MLSSFTSIVTRLMVGVDGRAPSPKNDIRLGDVVVSILNPYCPAVVQYDYDKTLADGQFYRTVSLKNRPFSFLTAVTNLKTNYVLEASQLPTICAKVFEKYPLIKRDYVYPGHDQDVLFKAGCDHVEEGQVCSTCGLPKSIERSPRSDNAPRIHYGPIASGNQVVKHRRTRDALAQELEILCFEMKAAGLMDNFPCLVIRGICDYSDAQKNKHFQKYAALTAAAYAKELSMMTPKMQYHPQYYRAQIRNRLKSTENLSWIVSLSIRQKPGERLLKMRILKHAGGCFNNLIIRIGLTGTRFPRTTVFSGLKGSLAQVNRRL